MGQKAEAVLKEFAERIFNDEAWGTGTEKEIREECLGLIDRYNEAAADDLQADIAKEFAVSFPNNPERVEVGQIWEDFEGDLFEVRSVDITVRGYWLKHSAGPHASGAWGLEDFGTRGTLVPEDDPAFLKLIPAKAETVASE